MNDNRLSDLTIEWAKPSTWVDDIGRWVGQRLKPGGTERLARRPRKLHACDDTEWLYQVGKASRADLGDLLDEMANDLAAARAIVFHGTRVDDPGCFSKEGLRVNDPDALERRVRELLREEPELARRYPDPDRLLSTFEDRGRDAGRLFLALDDRSLLDGGGHYLLYGSEWLQTLLGWDAHPVMRRRGHPTIVRAALPLDSVSAGVRNELAAKLLLEWARRTAIRTVEVPKLDFSFCLRGDLPPSAILGHEHPAEIEDPFHRVVWKTENRTCPDCSP
ncbi:hypothetical protein [Aureimonas sp. Leaf324]|jgi:hypothetical protein|uniref:hypothetical protein n=1 Tax=Aureimonas sp. Leaf324 TaxID=1736336 RepID=UPI0007010A01|nr:hypothetical protein [Aureimonas sp. Leaf324]KQQ78835.1 hypothetical protein ASF65_14735 [Aureimonas sp. Leaf324]